MTARQLLEMLEQPESQLLTCKEFAQLIRDNEPDKEDHVSDYDLGYAQGVKDTLDEVTADIKETLDIPQFLQEGFEPTSVKYNGLKVK